MIGKILKAIECCKEKRCDECPMQREICDELKVAMLDLPEDLVDKIVDELKNK